MRPMAALLLTLWEDIETSQEPSRNAIESDQAYLDRYIEWRSRHKETARLIHYLAHAGVTFNSKINFMSDWL